VRVTFDVMKYRIKQTIHRDKLKEPIKSVIEQDFEKFIKSKFQKIGLKKNIKKPREKKVKRIEILGKKWTNLDEKHDKIDATEKKEKDKPIKKKNSSPFSKKMKSIFERKK
jgi:hypothetical protein